MTEPRTDSILYAVEDGVATVTLNRPEAMNALDAAAKDALRDAVREAAGDASVRAVLLIGTGRAFCVGQDVRDLQHRQQSDPERAWATVSDHYNPIAYTLATMPKPVVAGVNGVAAGAGASFAFACDVRVMADTATFVMAFAGIGLSCDSGASWTLPRLVGMAKAKDLLLFARTVSAAQALELGLASEVVPAGELHTRVLQIARTLAAGPTLAYAGIRRSLAHAASHNLADTLAYEAEQMHATGASADHRDALAAFLAKRPPVFTGR